MDDLPEIPAVDLPWTVRFPPGWGAPESIEMTELRSWTESEVEGIKYFSGTAVYSANVHIPENLLDKDYSLFLDLGEVKETAEVRLNGEMAGILWMPPYRIDVTELV
ncbi:MAG: hypothetical protein MUO52_08755 [Desulfobacterales bacterium]|nr:hypothetical protein [Desulfobacterales bacterium]